MDISFVQRNIDCALYKHYLFPCNFHFFQYFNTISISNLCVFSLFYELYHIFLNAQIVIA